MSQIKLVSNNSLKQYRIDEILKRVNNPVVVDPNDWYKQIGIRSHGKGIFFKDAVQGKSLGNKRVFWIESNCFIVNIVFAWERAVARTYMEHEGYIASHRFPVYKPVEELVDLDYLTYFFKTEKGKNLLEMASPGGAGRNKTLGQKEFERLKVFLPPLNQQIKTAKILNLINSRITKQVEKINFLGELKKGMVQQIFNGTINFKDENGGSFESWRKYDMKDILIERREKGGNHSLKVHSVAVNAGVINQIEHLGRSFSAKDTSKYSLVKYGDLVYTKSPTGSFPFGIVKQSYIREDVIVSPLYGIFVPQNFYIGSLINAYFMYPENLNQYLTSIVNKGAKNTINITNSTFISKSIFLPSSFGEQRKISNYLESFQQKIQKEKEKLMVLEEQKKGFMQGMFV